MAADNLTLYHSKLCFQSIKIKALLDYHKLSYLPVDVPFGSPAELKRAVPRSVYLETPLLLHGDRIVEDFRAIIRYLDERFFGDRLSRLSAARLSPFFERMEHLDEHIFPALIAPVVCEEIRAGKLSRRLAARQFEFALDQSVSTRFHGTLSALEATLGDYGLPADSNGQPESEFFSLSILSVLKAAGTLSECKVSPVSYPRLAVLLASADSLLKPT